MKKTNFKLKTKVLNRAVSITALLLVAGVLFTGCPQKVKEELIKFKKKIRFRSNSSFFAFLRDFYLLFRFNSL